MLTAFKVKNFKNFNEQFQLDLTKTKSYEFNLDCVKDGIVNTALIYGQNGIGKSNLGYALFECISHLSDKYSGADRIYKHYLNALNRDSDLAEFEYEFKINGQVVLYQFGKLNHETLIYESLSINSEILLSIDRRQSTIATIELGGTEHLKKDMGDSQISLVNYVKNNAILAANTTTETFLEFSEFIDGMLYFRSLTENAYIGFEQGSIGIAADIIENNNVEDFELFLNEAGVKCKLIVVEDGDEPGLAFDFDGKLLSFFEVASTGTKALSTFYFWFQRLRDNPRATFVFIDEFDAFYHHDLSTVLMKRLRTLDVQVILTTHNTNLITNDILRPDCNFIMTEKELNSLPFCTEKELRSAHNIEKMYRAGVFGG